MVKFVCGDEVVYSSAGGMELNCEVVGWTKDYHTNVTIYTLCSNSIGQFQALEEFLTPYKEVGVKSCIISVSIPKGFEIDSSLVSKNCSCLCTWEGIVHEEGCSMYERVGYQPWPIQQQKKETKEELNDRCSTLRDRPNPFKNGIGFGLETIK